MILLVGSLVVLVALVAGAAANVYTSKYYYIPLAPEGQNVTFTQHTEDDCVENYAPGPGLLHNSFMYLWVQFLVFEMSVASVGGCIGLWYFHSDDPNFAMPSSPAFTALKVRRTPSWP
jgi:hypothetical protein